MKLNNTDAGLAARRRQEFTGGNLYGEQVNQLYKVYSYGYHFPMYVYDSLAGKWLGNSDKYSRSTTRHQSLCRPSKVDHWMDTTELMTVSHKGGLAQYVAWKLTRNGGAAA